MVDDVTRETTILLKQHPKINSDKLYVESIDSFEVGDKIVIDFGKSNEERFVVKAIPTQQEHSSIMSADDASVNPHIIIDRAIDESHNRYETEIYNLSVIHGDYDEVSTLVVKVTENRLFSQEHNSQFKEVYEYLWPSGPMCFDLDLEATLTPLCKKAYKQAKIELKLNFENIVIPKVKKLIKTNWFRPSAGYNVACSIRG
jgi:hypothetical protein